MAQRPVFMACDYRPYSAEWQVEFTFNSGFATVQKQKNITALHKEFVEEFPGKKVLEISSKSLQPEGVALSAFNLEKFIPSLGKTVTVECAYQAGKVFEHGGPFTDLLEKTSREAKKDERLHTSGAIVGFAFEDMRFPIKPATAFYDFLYMNALLENEELAKKVLEYDAFTDIEFNPKKSQACQANAAAKFVSLSRAGLIDQIRSVDTFLQLFRR
ncbi:MAG: hypothetical protein IJE08_01955 [Clostridia bacterium]|nr:hypothetical protein [Clostridia bacterium]